MNIIKDPVAVNLHECIRQHENIWVWLHTLKCNTRELEKREKGGSSLHTPLHVAIDHNNETAVMFLLLKGIRVGGSDIRHAARHGRDGIVGLLKQYRRVL